MSRKAPFIIPPDSDPDVEVDEDRLLSWVSITAMDFLNRPARFHLGIRLRLLEFCSWVSVCVAVVLVAQSVGM